MVRWERKEIDGGPVGLGHKNNKIAMGTKVRHCYKYGSGASTLCCVIDKSKERSGPKKKKIAVAHFF